VKIKYLFIIAALFLSASAYSQSLVLDVTYSRWENDLNKTTSTESYSVVGSSLMYSIDYGGKSMPGEIDEKKECTLLQYNQERIIKSIYDNKINRDEAVYRKERMGDENLFMLKITVNLVLDGTAYSILLEGESNLVMDNSSYLNVIKFIKDLRSITRDC
jgi:hypothetical protein